ncbi:hypothetical protein DUI87_04124 [Hirundo rustica rustica]|uniref:Uncharacterized protein n=1 Tax=Hirundo rustica rustica TaxID=333673 RepID=A0A3M0L1S4_HIRRU|nr:hypothetical protein DUI87_04124 [Hirundo rustica rustica]
MYSRYLATLQWRAGEDKVGVLVNKLRIYKDTVTAPFRTHVSSMETRLAEQVQSLIEEGHQKLKKELKEEIYHVSPCRCALSLHTDHRLAQGHCGWRSVGRGSKARKPPPPRGYLVPHQATGQKM